MQTIHSTWRAVVLLSIVGAIGAASPKSPEDRVAAQQSDFSRRFDIIWRETRNRFYDPNMNGRDWQAIGDQYRPTAASAKSAQEFQETINRMLGELRASHLGYYTDQDLEYFLLGSIFNREGPGRKVNHIGVTGVRDKDGFEVRAILDGSPAAAAGIRVGDRLLTANGRRFSTVGSFAAGPDEEYTITLNRPGTGRSSIKITPNNETAQASFLSATRSSIRIIERDRCRIGYIHLWCMTSDTFKKTLDDALTGPLQKTDGLILDLRDGFGGSPFNFADALFRPAIEWEEVNRNRRNVSHTGYGKPMVALINQGTRSAKEFFAYELKKTHRAILVGTNTAGAFLGANAVRIGDDGLLEIPVADLNVDGKRLEGVGVSPDIIEKPMETYGPKDGQHNRAIEVLVNRLKQFI